MEGFTELLQAIDALKEKNVIGIGLLMTGVIRMYRVIPGAPWPSEKWNWVVTLVTFVVGLLAAMLTGVFGFGLGWPAAVMAGLGVAINSAGFNATLNATLPGYKPKTFDGYRIVPTERRVPSPSPFRTSGGSVIADPEGHSVSDVNKEKK